MADRTLTDPLEGTLETAFPTRSLAAKALVRRWCLKKLGKERASPEPQRSRPVKILGQARPRGS